MIRRYMCERYKTLRIGRLKFDNGILEVTNQSDADKVERNSLFGGEILPIPVPVSDAESDHGGSGEVQIKTLLKKKAKVSRKTKR